MKKKLIYTGVPALLCALSAQTMAANILENTTFDRLTPWEFGSWEDSNAAVSIADGRACVDVTSPGSEAWTIQLRHNNLTFEAGHTYSFSADAWSSAPVVLKVDGSDETGEYVWHFGSELDVDAPLNGDPQRITAVFENDRDTTTGKLSFLMGLDLVPANTTVCIDNVSLDDPEAEAPDTGGSVPVAQVRVNQHAYIPGADKKAIFVVPEGTSPETSRNWELKQGDTVIASGSTTYFGFDEASDDTVHLIDFSSINTEADNYTIEVTADGQSYTSQPFAISSDAYSELKYDALAYFYHNRSSTPILASVVGDAHARDAGHPDTEVQTAECATAPNSPECRTADVSGGWYDAGDHGKYVVNGGISVWTMMNQFERSKYLGSNSAEFADGTMALPPEETNNGLPDILDEARWQVDFFLKMQVPEGAPNAGMVHHKINTAEWTAIPTTPADDDGRRILQPVSTAATLNFAAVGAQCYRVYRDYDTTLADRCLDAAAIAYDAAKSTPEIAEPTDGLGSGLYGDDDRTDEFYWAATELYVATGDGQYLNDMRGSDFHAMFFEGQTDPDYAPDSAFAWPNTEALGLVSMATVDGEFMRDADLKQKARDFLIDTADKYVQLANSQGYSLPFEGVKAGWGSNSFVINNMLVVGLANDFTCGDNPEYLNTMQHGMSYLLGANPMDQSYVTGVGERPLREPHHRFWANAASNLYPEPPTGALSGGPNQGTEDPIAKIDLAGCAPLTCFLDNIESWSTNEITINWNAPFAWVVAYMDEQATDAGRAATQACEGPVDPQEPTDPVDPQEPTDPVDPQEPTDPVDPVDPQEPTDPVDPQEPTDPVDPVDPQEPTDPVDPEEPTDPDVGGQPSTTGGAFGLLDFLALLLPAGLLFRRRKQ